MSIVDDAVKLAGERIDAWVSKLRSGEITPLKGALTNEDGTKMCCLGVLCVVAGLERRAAGVNGETETGFAGPVTGKTLYSFPPTCVANSVGIDEYGRLGTRGDGDFDLPDGVSPKGVGDHKSAKAVSLSQFNDWTEIGFSGIAAIIALNKDRMIESVRSKAQHKLDSGQS